jgi:pSer/pThr/pTyr-binding forkhead associated (FHA) protein
MKLSLVVLNAGKSAGQAIPINLAQFVIGRDPQCNLRPASALISKRHCALLIKGETAFIRDFESTNGTVLNDVPVKGEAELKNGDILKIGPLEFRVTLEASPAPLGSSTPTPSPASPQKRTPPPPTKNEVSQDDIGDMMLDLDDAPAGGESRDDSAVPEGSTVMDLPLPDSVTKAGADKKPEEKKKPAAPAGNAQAAAAALYAKLSKRR